MEQQTGFRKEIRLLDGIMLVAGTMIGSGIFIVSAEIARTVGSSGNLLLVWALSGALTFAVNGAWEIDDADKGAGIQGFQQKNELWQTRRRLAMNFWVDQPSRTAATEKE